MSRYVGISPTGPNGETFGAWMIGHHGEGVWCTPKGKVSGTWKVGADGQLVLEPSDNPMVALLHRIRSDPDYLNPTNYVIDCDWDGD